MTSPESPYPAPPQPIDPAVEFRRRLLAATPRVWVTPALIAINLGIFLAMLARGAGIMQPSDRMLIDWGANYGPLTTAGQWWRMLSCAFLHIGIIHLAFNMFVLAQVGFFVERLLGNIGFLAVYLVAGIGGSAASLLWDPLVLSAGASGAIFGLFGALLGFLALRREIPARVLAGVQNAAAMFVVYNIIFGLVMQGIDMAAHLGGLGMGVACGMVMSQRLGERSRPGRPARIAGVLALGLLALAVAVAAVPRWPDIPGELRRFLAMQEQAMAGYQKAMDRYQKDQITGEQFASELEANAIRPWREYGRRIGGIERVPPKYHRGIGLLREHIALRQREWELLARGLAADDADQVRQSAEVAVEADRKAKLATHALSAKK